jgi:hypothetical protein
VGHGILSGVLKVEVAAWKWQKDLLKTRSKPEANLRKPTAARNFKDSSESLLAPMSSLEFGSVAPADLFVKSERQ